ncbi:MAG: lysine biosynthesis protein LysW [Anaerolineae bacterium]
MTNIICVECEGEVPAAADIMLGELIECPDCGAELEVVNLNPLTVDLAPEIEEDWGE